MTTPSGPTLRLYENWQGGDTYQVAVRLYEPGQPQEFREATVDFTLSISAQEQADLRWYLEDYLQYPYDPAPTQAERIAHWMDDLGQQFFTHLFGAEPARHLWLAVNERLGDTRIEIFSSGEAAPVLPWELVCDPATSTPLALHAGQFVRAVNRIAPASTAAPQGDGPIRILLVICRPGGDDDVPFRSVASRLIKSLATREDFQLDVLRPPTFEQLSRVLQQAKAAGKPYHVVHFDGHGAYLDVPAMGQGGYSMTEWLRKIAPLMLGGAQTGAHGYLLFENPQREDNTALIDGAKLGALLVDADVPILVLNACRSAHADPAPTATNTNPQPPTPNPPAQAFGSLAQEVMNAGVAGVVAMRYNVYVVTAAQFVADLYGALTEGLPLGAAVTRGRKQLAAQPLREVVDTPRELQDWPVPVVYEAAPIPLFPPRRTDGGLQITIGAAEATPARGVLDEALPAAPDAGFWGRDETLLNLDRAFDSQPVVLLHAFAGSGKTTTAAEFARWYSLTGGVDGPVLFTTFEQYRPLARVLDSFGALFAGALEKAGLHWGAMDDKQRRAVTLDVLKQVPVLWIWDNVEPVTGFPAGTPSAWSAAEQRELVDFLRAARQTRAKFLLTSRRDEQGWLGDLPARVTLPPMPLTERQQLARALVEKYGQKWDGAAWRGLLRYSAGNPLTLTVVVGQALRDRLTSREQIDAYVARLRAGEQAFADDLTQGRSRSLGASLSYGFDQAFTEDERRQLALLHFFQGYVQVPVLQVMGKPYADWCLDSVCDLTDEAGTALLDRAAEIGLLTALGGGYYFIHPALPWFFKRLFDKYYPAAIENLQPAIGNSQLEATRAFVEAMGRLGDYYTNEYVEGDQTVIDFLRAEEANLLQARQMALTHGWWGAVISAMQGLRMLYEHRGRRPEWAGLVVGILSTFVDPATDGPLLGREEQWSFVTDYRVKLAEEVQQWGEAERLQRVRVDWNRQRAASALATPQEELDGAGRNAIRTLAVSVSELGNILREQDKPECIAVYEEDYELSLRIDDQPGAAVTAFNLGHAYKDLPVGRDLAQAERWYRRGLELTDEQDRLTRGKGLGQLGQVAYERFKDARAAKQSEEELLRHLNAAVHSSFAHFQGGLPDC